MLRLTSERRGPLARLAGDDWREHVPDLHFDRRDGPSTRWLVAGVVAVGLGFVAWHYLGPELRRYIKIHRM